MFSNDDVLKEYLIENGNQYSDSVKEKIKAYLGGRKAVLGISSEQLNFRAVQLANWFRVNNYFARQFDYNVDPITQMQVVKLLYFAYGRFLVKSKKRLFSSSILHLQYGPVVEEVHQQFKGMVVLDPDKPDKQAFEDYNLVSSDAEINDLLQKIDEDYSDYTASGLSRITHRAGSPWSMTEKGKPIKDQLIFDQFTKTEE
ncbi:Panacea domain-containing protein [Lactobacillus helveticus]|uniref:Panacea domain-containing protein n=1 Tax=Lactobacillus helveticus TaxID=1587 RepID=UPI0021518660|nr:type II toxin-antitoxin system antitoxin SocA domain-containing protein [Lactobacillus helveticus]